MLRRLRRHFALKAAQRAADAARAYAQTRDAWRLAVALELEREADRAAARLARI